MMAMTTPSSKALPWVNGARCPIKSTATKMAATPPAMVPSQVFPGLTCGAMARDPTRLPTA